MGVGASGRGVPPADGTADRRTVHRLAGGKKFAAATVIEPGGEPRLAVTRENGQVQLTLTGKQGSRYALETSTALANWISAGLTVTVAHSSGAVTFPAPDATSAAQRLYRAVLR